jgi:hypothetical protein
MGPLDLFGALNVTNGEVIARCNPQHRAQDFVAFLRQIESAVEPTLDIHVILDNRRLTARHRCSGGCCAIHASTFISRPPGLVAQSGGAVLWIADGESAQAWIAHEHSAAARRHPRVRGGP